MKRYKRITETRTNIYTTIKGDTTVALTVENIPANAKNLDIEYNGEEYHIFNYTPLDIKSIKFYLDNPNGKRAIHIKNIKKYIGSVANVEHERNDVLMYIHDITPKLQFTFDYNGYEEYGKIKANLDRNQIVIRLATL